MPEKPRQGTWAFIKGLSRVEWLTLGVLGLAQFCSAVTFACIVPFFPAEATRKGLNTTQVGLLIGVFQLVGFLVSPMLGKFMVQLGPKRLFTGGLLIGGFGAILFGLLRILPSGPAFFWTALLVRSVKALGSACFATSSLTIVAQSFPGKVGSVMSFMEICLGLGYTVGPLIGSVLYELGGFPLPFFVLGSLMLGSAAVSLLVLLRERAAIVDDNGMGKAKEVAEEEPKPLGQEAGWRLLAIPELWLTCWAIATLEASCFFYDASITEHLSDLEGGGPMLVGLMISLVSVTYLMTAPFLGWFIDRWPRTSGWIMLAGSLLIAVATSLMGPSPLLPLDKSVGSVSAAFALLGVAISPFFIPTFQHCINAARDHGFDEASTANCGLISGFLQGSNSLGGFLGATLGGASVSCFGFAWTATGVSGLNLCWFIAQAIFCVQKALRTNLAEKLPKRPLDLPVPADPSSTASISSSIAPQIIP